MIEDIQSGQPIKAMQPKAPRNSFGAGVSNNVYQSPGMNGGVGVPGPFGAGPGGNPAPMYGNPNAGYMTQQQQGFGMQPQYGMGGQPGMYQMHPMGAMGYQQPQQMMQQQQPGNAMAFL
jgi:hypothetical protein